MFEEGRNPSGPREKSEGAERLVICSQQTDTRRLQGRVGTSPLSCGWAAAFIKGALKRRRVMDEDLGWAGSAPGRCGPWCLQQDDGDPVREPRNRVRRVAPALLDCTVGLCVCVCVMDGVLW